MSCMVSKNFCLEISTEAEILDSFLFDELNFLILIPISNPIVMQLANSTARGTIYLTKLFIRSDL